MATPTYDLNAILKQAGVGSNFVNQTNAGKNTQSIDQIMQLVTQLPDDSEERAGLLDSTFGLPTDAFSTALANKVRSGADLGDLRKQLTDYYGADGISQLAFVDPNSLDARRLYVGSNGKLLATSKYNEGQNWAQKAISVGVPLGLAAMTGNAAGLAAGGGAIGAVAGGATAGGVNAAATGGDIGKGILMGGALGGLGAGIKNFVAPGLTEALGPTGGKIATGAVQGAAGSAIKGGNILQGALQGGLNTGIKTGLGGLSSLLGTSTGDAVAGQPTDQSLTGAQPGSGGSMDFDFNSGLSLADSTFDPPDVTDTYGTTQTNWFGGNAADGYDFSSSGGIDWSGLGFDTGDGGGLSGLGSALGGALSSAGSGLMSLLQKNPQLFGTLGATGLAALAAGKPGPVDSRISPAIDQLKAISGQQLSMANDSYARQKALMTEFSPLLRQQIQQSITSQGQANQRANDIWSDYTTNFQPVQAKLAQTALNYDTPERRAEAAREAESRTASQYQLARDQQNQAMFSSGLQPGSGKALALDSASRIAEARAKAGAGSDARTGIETRGLQLVDNAARFGLNLPGLSTQQSSLGLNQGQAAQAGLRNLGELTAAPESVAAPLYSSALSGAGAVGQLGIGLTGAQNGQYVAKAGLVGDLLGAGLKAYNYYGQQPKQP